MAKFTSGLGLNGEDGNRTGTWYPINHFREHRSSQQFFGVCQGMTTFLPLLLVEEEEEEMRIRSGTVTHGLE